MGEAEVRVVVRKFDGSLHWHHSMMWLGEDEYGIWLGAPIGTIYGKGNQRAVYATEERRVMLFPRGAWWTALFQAAPAHLDVYCDLTSCRMVTPGRSEDSRPGFGCMPDTGRRIRLR
ncbi:hypothetical protein [Streptomyces sp. SAS_270]|uniref:hypothetical protein n=1 Tax=Streptomyces sp. SAS_270 TaxID=3412748 RepID=UPI00403C4D45